MLRIGKPVFLDIGLSNHLSAIRLKSGSLKSLQVYLFEKGLNRAIRFNLDLPRVGTFRAGIRAGKKQGEVEYKLLSLPLYMCFQLPQLLTDFGSW
jgi:hypothetical protein